MDSKRHIVARSVLSCLAILAMLLAGATIPAVGATDSATFEAAPYGYDTANDIASNAPVLDSAAVGGNAVFTRSLAIAPEGAYDSVRSLVAPSGTGSGFANLGDEISDGARMVDQPLRPSGYNQAITPEKLDHIFVPKHNLDPLVTNLGSREAVIEQMLIGIRGQTPASGVFEIPTVIGGQTVVVRGAVVDGVPRLGTAFTP